MFSNLGTLINTIIFGKKVGQDEFKNKYYNSKNNKKRWVIYFKKNDASSVPPEWQAWLTQTVDTPPSNTTKKHDWLIPHKPNVAENLNINDKYANNNQSNHLIYKPWKPK